jgi:hypothetical protein
MGTSGKTLAFSIISYLLIAILAFLYIHFRVGFRVLFSPTSPGFRSLSGFAFGIALAVFSGIGACVCLTIALGMAVGGREARDSFISRTMQACDDHKATIGDLLFSDFSAKPRTILDALRLQAKMFVRALFKILSVYLSVALLNRVMMVVLGVLFFVPNIVLGRQIPMLWNALAFLFWFLVCYRAQLFSLARAKGVARTGDERGNRRVPSSSLESSIQFASTNGVTPEFIQEILGQESIIQAIKDDLMRTGQIGYKEVWRLGLITPDQDRFDPGPSGLSRRERMDKLREDSNYRANLSEQIALKRTAVLYNRGYFGIQPNRLTVAGGSARPRTGFLPGWSHRLSTRMNRGEFVRIRDLLIDVDSASSRNRSPLLPQFLREAGFPLKASYEDGDPLTSDRSGTVVIDKGQLVIIYPRYFVQRRLIDDLGNLVDLGLDEDFGLNPVFAVKMRPSVSEGLVRSAKAKGYIPVVRYRTVPYASDFLFPILDTPMSDSGWADLFIDTRGKGKLFIAKDKSLAEWYEMMNRLRELFFSELARKDYHLLGLAQDGAHLSQYMAKKQGILANYYIIQDWAFP